MQKTSIKKFSVLGLVLICASAVAAAFVPAKESTKDEAKKADSPGRLTATNGNDGATCVTTAEVNRQCTNTESAGGASATSNVEEDQVTSGDTGGNGDTNTTLGE